MSRDRTVFGLAVALAVLLCAGLFLPQWALFMMTLALANGLVVLGLMLLLRAGLVSFGQGLFFGLGAYAAGMLGRLTGVTDALVLLAAGGLTAALLAFVLGFLLARYRGIFFGLLSLAFSMILYGLLVKSEALGSTDGFNIVPVTLAGWKPQSSQVRYTLLAVAGVWAFVIAALVDRFLATARGRLLPAIKDNEIRVEYMGASVQLTIHIVYVIAAALAGVGGALAGVTVGHIDPQLAYWTTSGEFIFIGILAGIGSVAAPFVGALVYGIIYSVAFGYSPNTWQMVIGLALLAVIVFLPEGLWSLVHRRRREAAS